MTKAVWLVKAPDDNRDPNLAASCAAFLEEIAGALGEPLVFTEDQHVFSRQSVHLFFIGSGGSEQVFKAVYERVPGPYILLTTRSHNSLAASMEILSYLNEQGQRGEILHGSPQEMAARLRTLIRVAETRDRLRGMRLGVTGESDWLISRPVDADLLRERSGMELIHIPMPEVTEEIAKETYEDNEWTLQLKARGYDSGEMERALQVYGACRRLVDKYMLDGFTLRCFDLLEPFCITGCLALGILNAEGIWAACEGDSRSLVSMAVIGELTGQPVFMANPSRLYPAENKIVFAHCILPLNMSKDYGLTTHFESGLGISVSADFDPQACTVFKCRDDFDTYYAADARLLESMHEGNLCRTQMKLEIPSGLDYFTSRPIANHHMIVLGHHQDLVDEFFHSYR
ncbi:MAG TPA: hypothetical protein PK646_04065 [Bacillota bacterium]|nr:hypothetical protein [Fastidiosipila sp.]HPX93475.1 hypothetical protein [Bacillota bacterium]HQB81246.1 hypothetical protein [Bacillota bacterium]